MKNIIKILFIAFIFVCSLCISKTTINTHNVVSSICNNVISQQENNEFYNTVTNTHKFIIPTHKTSESIILSKKNNDNLSSFGGFKNLLTPDSNQFILLLSYIYNKSRLSDNFKLSTTKLLTEISPNAP